MINRVIIYYFPCNDNPFQQTFENNVNSVFTKYLKYSSLINKLWVCSSRSQKLLICPKHSSNRRDI